ncbi:MAG TPA: transposase [Burkholderiales bacterium]|nr:transposase [Burkholderiales bacterium]
MARPLRLEFAGALYHVTARGNARAAIFLDDADRELFLKFLGREVEQQRWRLHAYCLMPNHYHLLLETPEPNLARGMARLNAAYSAAFNRRHSRSGHLFQGRYKSILVEREPYFLELCRYVVLNPVRARMCKDPANYRWSSYSATAGRVPAPDWLDCEAVLSRFGESSTTRRARYRRFVMQGIGKPSPWQQLRGQVFLGGSRFLERMEGLARAKSPRAVPRAQLRPARPSPSEVLAEVAQSYEVPVQRIRARAHQPALRAAAYLLRRACNLGLAETAALFGVSSPRISQIQRRVETGTNDRVFERLMRLYKVKL